MEILFNNYFIQPHNNLRLGNNQIKYHSQPKADYFISSKPLNFTGRKDTTLETTYKSIEGVHDPYSDILMLSEQQLEEFKKQINKHPKGTNQIEILSKYTYSMFKPEKEIYNLLRKEYLDSMRNPKDRGEKFSISDVIKKNVPEANKHLIKSELAVINKIEEETIKNLSPESQDILSKKFNTVRNDIASNSFRIKNFMDDLHKLKKQIPEQKEYQKIIDMISMFPRSATSSDVFIVKNKDKTSEEIAIALLTPSVTTIEHIKPQSKGGHDSSTNYLVASSRMNSIRSSNNYEEFINNYPEVPEYCQIYADDIISNKNSDVAKLIAQSLPHVKKSLLIESDGLININIDALDDEAKNKTESLDNEILKLITKFKHKNNT